MKRHLRKWIDVGEYPWHLDELISHEMIRGKENHGNNEFNSPHELYAVLKEEVEEFWDSIKKDDPDPMELLQICAVAKRGIIEMCRKAKDE